MAKHSTGPAVVVGVLCASVSAWSQVLADFDFPLWLQLVFTAVTGAAAGVVVALETSRAAGASSKKALALRQRLIVAATQTCTQGHAASQKA